MKYKIYDATPLQNLLYPDDEHLEGGLVEVETSISDLVVAREECLVWLLPAETLALLCSKPLELYFGDLQKHPLAANYHETGSGDISDKILIQDPIFRQGPYVLDRSENPDNKVFRRGGLTALSKPGIIPCFTAGDKISDNRFYFAGDAQELFRELQEKGYALRE
jgi:hypothetical protein